MWRRLFRKPSDADLAEELEAHLAIETKQWMDRGLPREQAELQARRLFGSRALTLEATREVRGIAAFGRFSQDLRYAARVLRRSPAFTAAAVLSLALGIGVSTAIFSIADTIFLRPQPYRDAAQLTWVAIRFPDNNAEFLPSPDYVAWRHDNQAFEQLAATGFNGTMVLGGPSPAEVRGARVSANFLDAFAITPAAGRSFNTQEELPNGPKAVLLTDHVWRDRFQSRRDILGSSIPLDGQPYTVIGILPPSFAFPLDTRIDLLTTLPVSPTANHRDRSMFTWSVFGRLKPGVTMVEARADLDRLFANTVADFPQLFHADNHPVLESLRDHRAGRIRIAMFLLMGAAAFLLAIACANVANLLLARWSARGRELAVRAAIGAGRGRLARQLFTEIALLIAAGTLVALLLMAVALRAFVHFAAAALPRLSEVTTDFRVFGIALLVSLVTALLFGGLPALRAGRVDPQSVLRRGAAPVGHRFLRHTLVTVEVALSVILLSGAALLFQTLWHLQNDHLGFQPEHLLTVTIPLRGPDRQPAARNALIVSTLAELRRIPGTEAGALTECTPMSGGSMSITFSRSDRPLPEPFHRGDSISLCGVGPDYFLAAGSRTVQGRFFTDEDFHHLDTLAVINEAAARAYFPGESALGKEILGGRAAAFRTVVGVIADSKNQGLNRPAAPQAFIDNPVLGGAGDLLFLVRGAAPEGAVARVLRAAHPHLFSKVETLDQAIGQMTATPRFNTVLLSAFAGIAFLMAMVGVYGVLAFSVTQRRAEIGIRMALGVSPRAVLALVMREGALLVAAGALAGIAGALILTRSLATLLYGVEATDPRTYAAVVAMLVFAALTASFLPARKAAVVDPVVTLRHE
ncbi:MAG: ABC transporter permease [Candidatus Sulfopaludibacter sp.]|nr:ABC transporter permease [Candidatus Sulfopaludibacter sp.]